MSKRIVKAAPAVETTTEAAPGVGTAEGGSAPPAGDEVDLKVDVAVNGGADETAKLDPGGFDDADAYVGDRLAQAAATAPRAQDEAGRPVDQWGLPLNGPARARALAELDRRDPHTHPEDWPDQGAVEE